jgi:tripartite-type tricarboxylate transporter receptor subunit TctC
MVRNGELVRLIEGEMAMNSARRRFLQSLAAGVTFPSLSKAASAAIDYPTRPVRLIVGFPPGGPTDITARLVAQRLSKRFNKQFIVENRAGAGSNIATELVAHSSSDGYTLLLVTTINTINTSLYSRLDFNFVDDIEAVASLIRYPLILIASPSLPVQNVPDLIAYAKLNPGKLNIGSGGIGTPFHLAAELFKMTTKTDMLHVPYSGSAPMIAAMLAGQVQLAFDAITSSMPYVKSGALRGLAVTSADRSPVLPNLPTMNTFVPGYEVSGWHGIGAPKNTPTTVTDELNREINLILADPSVQARIAELGATVFPSSPAQFKIFIAAETKKWRKVVKFAGLKIG